jgi:trimeric autotransporter adhesin
VSAASVSTSGNITGGNVNAGGLSLSGNVVSPFNVTGNVTGGNIISVAAMSAATMTTTGNALVGGDLIVNGNLTYLNISSFNVEDPIIGLGRGANDTPLVSDDNKDRGTDLFYFDATEKQAFVGFKDATGKCLLQLMSALPTKWSQSTVMEVL